MSIVLPGKLCSNGISMLLQNGEHIHAKIGMIDKVIQSGDDNQLSCCEVKRTNWPIISTECFLYSFRCSGWHEPPRIFGKNGVTMNQALFLVPALFLSHAFTAVFTTQFSVFSGFSLSNNLENTQSSIALDIPHARKMLLYRMHGRQISILFTHEIYQHFPRTLDGWTPHKKTIDGTRHNGLRQELDLCVLI